MGSPGDLAEGTRAGLTAQAAAEPYIAAAILGSQGNDVIDQALRNSVISKELKLEMSTPEVVFGIFPRGTAMAMIAENAYARLATSTRTASH